VGALAAEQIFLFDDFRLDRQAGGLFRIDADGVMAPIALGSRALDLLTLLVRRHGDLVSKDEIMTIVWPGVIVEDSNLPTQISALRRVVDKGRSSGSCIQTVPGRGYRFVASVSRCAADDPEPTHSLLNGRSPVPQPPSISSAGRRQLTVMISDLAGSTALAERLDPEDLREVIAAYHRAVAEIVARFDGYICRYTGDCVLVYFGYPQAHEDDAERAVRAGLGLIDAVGRLDVKPIKLQARVGIATGLVVVGDLIGEGSAREQLAVGAPPHLAARLQTMAEPGTVVIAPSTRRLVGDLFEYRELGAVEVKGMAAPVPAWQVLRPSAVASRFEALRGSALTPLVGRDEEIDLLLRRWARAKAGDGQIVLVSGEPGIGKSRIAAELEGRLQAEPHIRLRYFCSPYYQDSALYPFVDQFGRASGFVADDLPAARLDKLEALLSRAAPPGEDVALLADLMSLPASERHPLPNLSPQRKKERTLEALIRQLEGLARHQPVIMVFEDAHWIDPTSRELLDLMVGRVGRLPVLLIVTFRSEFQPHWTSEPQVSILALNRLDRSERAVLVEQIVGGKALPDDIVAQIVDRTDGVPLFVEELTKSVLETALLRDEEGRYVLDGAPSPFAIPTSLQDSLMARLDRLASVRVVAQIGAAIGREFSYALLRTISCLPEDELQRALTRLVASELVFQRGRPPESVYTFKHALVQDAAHGSLLRSARQQLHAQIAEALETHFPELIENRPELLAQHYSEAGLIGKSVSYWGKAGRRSAARSAMAEAAAQFQKGLEQLALLPNNFARQREELEFRSSLGTVLQSVKGYAADETGRNLARARELWEQLGSPSEFLQVAYAQSIYHAIRGELKLAHRLDEDLLRLSRQHNEPAGLFLAHQSRGRNLMFAGRLVAARSHLEESIALCDSDSDQSVVRQAGLHPQVASQGFLAIVLLCLGHPVQALARITAAIADARRLAHLPSLAMSLTNAARLLSFIGNGAALDKWASELATMADDQGFLLWRAAGIIFRGWVRVNTGDVAKGISLLHKGLAAYRATGAQAWVPYQISLLARAYEIVGQIEDAVDLLDNSLEIAERTGERWLTADLYRHQGQLVLRLGDLEAAEVLYRKALSIAREQEAKFWELRAAASLARLWLDQGKRADARNLLAPVYGWFIEGFATPDLKEAKALLDELNV
jgi:class 3 adenylate cyclase/predicted ATPase